MRKPGMMDRLKKFIRPDRAKPSLDTRWLVPTLSCGDCPGNVTFKQGPAPDWAMVETVRQLARRANRFHPNYYR